MAIPAAITPVAWAVAWVAAWVVECMQVVTSTPAEEVEAALVVTPVAETTLTLTIRIMAVGPVQVVADLITLVTFAVMDIAWLQNSITLKVYFDTNIG